MPKNHYILTIILIIFTQTASAQYTDTVVQYLDEQWEQVDAKKSPYYYYRVARKTKGGKWHVKDYYRDTKKLQSEGLCLDDSLKIYDGEVYYYYYNGQLQKECSYYKGTPVGVYKAYSIDGKLTDSMRYKYTGIPYKKAFKWNEEGSLIFYGDYDPKGSGEGYETSYYSDSTVCMRAKYTVGHMRDSIWSYYRKDGSLSLTETYDSGKLISYACHDLQGKPTQSECDTAFIAPHPEYDVYKYWGENVRMPSAALESGLSGSFLVQIKFFVDLDGKIKHPRIIYGSYKEFNDEAMRIVKMMPKWQPGMTKNRTIRVYYTLPVRFKIN